MNDLLNSVRERAKELQKTIVLAEGEEPRIITAAAKINAEHIAKIVLLGDPAVIAAKCPGADLNGIKIVDIAKADTEAYATTLYELRKAKGMDMDSARKLVKDPLYFGVMMVKNGEADGMVAGSVNATGDVLRPALQIIKTAPGIKTVSSCFIMAMDKSSQSRSEFGAARGYRGRFRKHGDGYRRNIAESRAFVVLHQGLCSRRACGQSYRCARHSQKEPSGAADRRRAPSRRGARSDRRRPQSARQHGRRQSQRVDIPRQQRGRS